MNPFDDALMRRLEKKYSGESLSDFMKRYVEKSKNATKRKKKG